MSGRRLDAESPPLIAHIPCCYPTGFQPTGLTFPSAGCWEIKATAGSSELTFVTEVLPPPTAFNGALAGSGGLSTTSLGGGPASVSYGQLTSTAPSQPVAVSIFALSLNGILVTEAGVPAVSTTTKARLFVDYTATSNTGVALVNPGVSPITILVELRNQSGVLVSSANLTICPKVHLAKFVNEMGLTLSTPFLGTLTLSSSSPFAAVNLRTTVNAHGEPLFSALPLADLNSPPASGSLIFSQIVDGGGIPTEILLMNPSSSTAGNGTISLFDDNGSALSADFGPGVGVQSTLNYSLPANGMLKFSTTGVGQLRAGYAVVTPSSGPLPIGSGIFSINSSIGLASQVGVLNAPQTTAFRLFADLSSSPLNRNTGIALVNANSVAAAVDLSLLGPDGMARKTSLTLGAKGHLAKFISELFSGQVSADFQGILTVTSNVPIAPLTLRHTINQCSEPILSILPAADLNNPPVGSLYLPQIVDGGGFRTQLIFINTSNAPGNIHIDFFNDNGAKVPTPIR